MSSETPVAQIRLRDLIDNASADAVALVRGADAWTWSDTRHFASGLERILDELGLGEGARVGIVIENAPPLLATVAEVIASGRCVTTLSPLQPVDRLVADVHASALPVVVASREGCADPAVRAAVEAHGALVVVDTDGSLRVTGSVRTARTALPGVVIEMFTSGTTGAPKRVELTYRQFDTSLTSAAFSVRAAEGSAPVLSRGATIICTPCVHIGGLWNAVASMFAGRRTVLMDRFTVAEWVDAVETYRPAAAGLVPAAMQMLVEADIAPEKLASLEVVTSGTAPCPPALADEMLARYGIRVLMTYGATEFAGAVAGWTKPDHERFWPAKRGAAGRAFPGVRLRVVGPDGPVESPGEAGVLEIRAAQAPNNGADWIRTSDLARIDEDGFLWIEGRADDAIIRGGFKVHPATVKRALEGHPEVREASVAGLADDRLGGVPVAAVELRPGATVTAEELRAFSRQALLPYEVPARLLVVEALPRTAAMKVDRVALLALFTDEPAAVAQ